MSQKLYIGNLPFSASEEEVRTLFSEAGTVESVRIITDAYSGRSRGFGFVEMASREEGAKAISLFNGKVFMERSLVVNEAKPQKRREGAFKGRRKS